MELQERGFTGGEPLAVAFGPFSPFGTIGTGWYLPTKDSFILLTLEGRLVTETEVIRFGSDRITAVRQVQPFLEKRK